MKRLCDLFFSTLFLLVFWPFYFIVAVIIKCVSPGPAIYKAERVGRDGEIFTLFKFRSMCVDSGEIKLTTLQNDDRVFAFGKFLRKCKIDETLQIFNILRSDMSIVGFRPEDIKNADQIFKNEYKEILKIKPGLTSPASLFDYTHGEKYENEEMYKREFLPLKLEMELYYAQNRTFWYDVTLVLRTIAVIFQKIFGKENFNFPPEYKIVLKRIEDKQRISEETVI